MLLSVMQPTFLPWIGYFDMIDQADLFVLYDNVQLAKQSWQVRNRVKQGKNELMLRVPVAKDKPFNEMIIGEARIRQGGDWPGKMLALVELSYRKAGFFEAVYPVFEEIVKAAETLGDLNGNLIQAFSERMGIETKFFKASEMAYEKAGKDASLVNMCRELGADAYLSARGSAAYIEAERPGGAFVPAGIKLLYHQYAHPEYKQLKRPFLPYMGIIDLLFNVGFGEALGVIRQGRKPGLSYQEVRKEMQEND